jgi:outer membrane protein assembly complex protein YaeT
MDPTQGTPHIRPNWFARHKLALAIGLGSLLLITLLLLAGLNFIISGNFNRYLSNQLEEALGEYGLRAEIGNFEISWRNQTATISEAKVYNQQTGQLIATINQAEMAVQILDPFALRLHREIVFNRLDLNNLIIRLEVDEEGRSNLYGLRPAPPSEPGRITFDFSSLIGALNGGALYINDRARKIEGELRNLQANAQALPGGNMVKGQLSAGEGRLRYQDREMRIDSLEIAGRGGEDGAEVERFTLRSPVAQAAATGRIDDWSALRYRFSLQAQVALDELAEVFEPGAGLQGAAGFDGRIEGEGTRYQITGQLESGDFIAGGARVRGARLEGITVASAGEKISFECKRAAIQAVEIEGVRLTNVIADAILGEVSNGRIRGNVPRVSVDRIENPEGQISVITLQKVTATLDEARYEIRGNLAVRGGNVRGASFGPLNGVLIADNNAVALNQFNASLFGGSAAGDFTIQTGQTRRADPSGGSRLQASFTGIKTGDIFTLVSTGTAPLAGTVDGKVDVRWPGTDLLAATGTLTSHLSGDTTQTPDAIPVKGDVGITATSGIFDVNRFTLYTDASSLSATGRFSREGDSDLRFTLISTSAEQLQTIAYSIDAVRNALEKYEPQIVGDLKFEGRVAGTIKDPTIEGDLNAASILLHDELLGGLTGHFFFSPVEVRFDNGVLTAPNNGTLKFSYAAPRDKLATDGRLDAVLFRIQVDTLIAAAGLPVGQKLISGDISGQAHLSSLPAAPRGTVTVNLVDGVIAGQATELATANLVLDGQTARIDRAEVRLSQGHLVANGTLDLKSNVFQLQGKAESIDLGVLLTSLEIENPVIGGTATVNLRASGNTSDLDQLQIELTANGKDVTINGHPAGQLSLTTRTSQKGRIDLELITGISGEPQTVRASMELQKPGRPIEVETDMTDLDIGPIITAFAPNLASSIDGVIGGRLRVAGPTVDDRGEVTFNGLRGNLAFTGISLQVTGRKVNVETPFTVTLDGPQLTLQPTRVFGEGVDLSIGGTLALSEDAKMNFAVNGTANLDALSQLDPDFFFSGTMTINARIEGSANEPRLGGDMSVNGFTFSSLDPQFSIEDGNGRILLSGDKVTLESFTARANDGKISANGTVTLAQFQPKEWRFGLNASGILLFYQGAQLTLDGDLTLTGTPQGQLLSGKVIIPQAEYTTDFDFERIATTKQGFDFGAGGGGGRRRTNGLAPVSLDVRVEANESLFVQNAQINTVGSAFLTVGGRLRNPSITGRITFEGGTIRFRSQRYDITTGTIEFPIGAGMTPVINAMAEGDVTGYHVYVGLTGPLNDMDVTLRSEPDLPRSEVLSLITTGRTDSDTLGSDELARSGVGTAASLLSQQLISQPTESLLGLSRFQIDPVLRPNDNPAARITIGQQVTRDLSFTYSTNLASEQDQTALLEYAVTNRFSVVGSFTQGSSSAQGGSNNNDLAIELRGRRRFSLGYLGVGSLGPAGTARPSTRTPSRAKPTPLPPADVSIEKPEDVKLSEKKLRELLPIKKSGYSPALARLGERNLTDYLQEQGYFFATVSSRCEPADCRGPDLRVIYDVQPGTRHVIKDIRIEGTDRISLGDVRGAFQTQTARFFGRIPFLRKLPFIGGYARGITSDDRLQHDRDIIRRRLVNRGYRSARVDSRLATMGESADLIVIFDVKVGSRSIISGVVIRGNAVIKASELRESVQIEDNQPFSITKLREGTQKIRQFYTDRGYLDATVDLDLLDLPDDRVQAVYNVTEGNRSVASEVLITGQTKTHEESIRRFLPFKPGDTLTPEVIRRTQRDLYDTGAFREVNIRSEPVGGDDASARRVTVGVTEAKPLLFVYGTGYSTDDGPRGLLQLSHTNLFGRVNTASVRMRVSGREQFGQISYIDLRPFNTKWATTVSAYYDRNTDLQSIVRQAIVDGEVQDVFTQSYGINRSVAFIQTERKLSEITSVRFRYNYEDSRLSNVQNIPIEEIGRNDRPIRLGLVSAGFTHDTRDSALNPTRGHLFSADHSIAARIFGGNEAFNRFFGNYQYYRTLPQSTPLLRDSVLATAVRIGLADPFKVTVTGTFDDKLLPISERFFAGGSTTLRGFRFEQAGPQVVLEPRFPGELPALVAVGGNALTIFNFELRYPLSRRFRIVPFYDLGNVFPLVSDIRFGGMTNSVGLGIRVNTPIGPVGVDYGFLLDPPSFVTNSGAVLRQPRGAIHIRFGQSF